MNEKINHQIELDTILKNLEKTNNSSAKKPSLLLHACCAPCSSYVIEYLSAYFDITILYYNPNIYPQEEYERRLSELKNFLARFPIAIASHITLVVLDYTPQEFYEKIGIEKEPLLAKEAEKGERCKRCYMFRMKRAYNYAYEHKFDWFTTTLSISPFKDAEKINDIGKTLQNISGNLGTQFLPSDFKKRNGFKRSLELSAEYGLYRQQYCGCVYSMHSADANTG
ncbi:MAG: epoxyqueuosine reductase QueH [Treponema sp.]|nr:epoxyqueuosine reductase QueH [Treponema sp.]